MFVCFSWFDTQMAKNHRHSTQFISLVSRRLQPVCIQAT